MAARKLADPDAFQDAAAPTAGSHARGQPRAQQLRPALSDSGGCVCPALFDPVHLASVLRQFAHGPSRASPPRSLDIFRSLAVCGSALRTARSLQSWQTSPSIPSWPPSRRLRALAKTVPTLNNSFASGNNDSNELLSALRLPCCAVLCLLSGT